MKKKKFKIKYNMIIFTILTLLVCLFWAFLLKSNILPLKYLLIGFSVFLVWLFIVWLLLFFKRDKKKKKRDIIAYIISAFLLLIMSLIFIYLNNTLNFFEGLNSNKYKEENYLVVALSDSEYESLSDLDNIGYVSSELNKISEALDKVNEETDIDNVKYEKYDDMFTALFDKEIDSLLIEESYLTMIKENHDYENLIKTIYKVTISVEIETESKSVDVTENPFTVYISGIDTYGTISSVSRSDVNMVVTVNPKTKQILMISIPRDYYVQLHGTTGYKDKLTHAGLYGIDTSVETIEDLLDTDINYYYRVNFSTLEKIVNAIGGIDVYSEYTFTSYIGNYRFYKGYNHMNGNQALGFARERKALPGGDRSRGENQQAVIDGVVRKVTSSAIITKYTSLINSLNGTFQSNMDDTDILKLIKMQLNDMASWNITSYSLNGSDSYEYTYSYSAQKLYVMEPDMDTVNEATSLINAVNNGDTLDSSYSSEASNIKNPITIVKKPEVKVPEEEPSEEPEEEPVQEDSEEKDENPVITLNGDDEITIEVGTEYEELGASAVDVLGEELEVVITGDVDVTLVGEYTVTYTATDLLENSSYVERTINVVESIEEPSEEPTEQPSEEPVEGETGETSSEESNETANAEPTEDL